MWRSEEILCQKYFQKHSTILDVGCGSGRTTFGLARLGYTVRGIDLTPAMIESAHWLAHLYPSEITSRITFQTGDATALQFQNCTFDNVLFSFNGLNQIPGKANRLLALKELYRVLKPGGYFIFSSHLRSLKGHSFFWAQQWFKLHLFKPWGANVREIEFGDRFFRRGSHEVYEHEQFIHIPSFSELKTLIKHSGFMLESYEYRNTIAPNDAHLSSGNCLMIVCRKAPST